MSAGPVSSRYLQGAMSGLEIGAVCTWLKRKCGSRHETVLVHPPVGRGGLDVRHCCTVGLPIEAVRDQELGQATLAGTGWPTKAYTIISKLPQVLELLTLAQSLRSAPLDAIVGLWSAPLDGYGARKPGSRAGAAPPTPGSPPRLQRLKTDA
jgi:hypothetical protein